MTYTAAHDLGNELAPSVTLLESPSLLAAERVTGLRTWEAALYLGTYLDSPAGRPWVQGRNILELGAGTGLVSLLCAKHLGARFVMATDGSNEVVHNLEANLGFNGLAGSSKIKTGLLKWGHALVGEILDAVTDWDDHEPREAFKYDLVIGADVVSEMFPRDLLFYLTVAFETYDDKSIRPLVSTLRELFTRNPQSKALILATLRNEQTFTKFLDACRQFSPSWNI